MTPEASGAALLWRRAVALAMQGQDRVGVAVSGGGDSMALLHLAQRASHETGARILAVTVDHGLRAGSAAEAVQVARHCAGQGIAHQTLLWRRDTAQGNLQAAARVARYGLMGAWAQEQGIGRVLLGHTQDDQAETFLMRLGREAGLDGLCGMPARFMRHGIDWHRPLLEAGRADLRDYLRAAGLVWSDDPSNDDLRFARIKARAALEALAPLGIDAGGLSRVMAQLEDARAALRHEVQAVAARLIRQEHGDLLLDWPALEELPYEVIRRCVVAALMWVSGSPYPPRREDVSHVILALTCEGQRTLAGCLLRRQGRYVRIGREYNALRDVTGPTDRPWDGRWQLDGPHDPALHVAALGEAGLRLCPDWRDTGLPRAALIAAPAVWRGEHLVAAPLAGVNPAWSARIVADFHATLLSH